MSEFEFTIKDWAAYAAGLTDRQQWLDWASASPELPAIDPQRAPSLIEMPAMARRRLNSLGRLACQVAWWCQAQPDPAPMVFASRYGDSGRSLALLGDLVNNQPLSPTAFGLSVHNAVSALYGIARGHTGNAVAVCAGRETAGAALSEAAGLLSDGANDVLLVFYEAPLPQQYTTFHDEDLAEYAWCWRLAKPSPETPRVRLRPHGAVAISDEGETVPSTWPRGLSMLHQALRQIADARVEAEPAHV